MEKSKADNRGQQNDGMSKGKTSQDNQKSNPNDSKQTGQTRNQKDDEGKASTANASSKNRENDKKEQGSDSKRKDSSKGKK